MRTGVLSFPVYSEAHSRRGAAFASKMNLRDAHATCCTSSISSNSFTSYFFFLHTLSSHFQTLCASSPCAINHFRTLCKIPGIGCTPLRLFFSTHSSLTLLESTLAKVYQNK